MDKSELEVLRVELVELLLCIGRLHVESGHYQYVQSLDILEKSELGGSWDLPGPRASSFAMRITTSYYGKSAQRVSLTVMHVVKVDKA